MTAPAPFRPQALFASTAHPAPRALAAPQRYIQGDGVIDDAGKYLALIGARRAGVLVSRRGESADGARVIASLKGEGIECVVSTFRGESSLEEIERHVVCLGDQQLECLIAIGGGKSADTGKSVAHRLHVPAVVIPTLASNDAPCSALSVLYSSAGEFAGAEFFPLNPALVIVDSGVVANAPPRYLVAGMGDAMATWYEARACLGNRNARSMIGARPTLASCALAEICAETLFEQGEAAARAAAESRVDDALEGVIEANTLLSGIGFESGGLAVAHSLAQSYTLVKAVHDLYLHGEMVAMGTLAQLMMESREEAKRVAEFFARVGLPVHLGQVSLSADDEDALTSVIDATMASAMIHNMAIPVTRELLDASILGAHELGLEVTDALGDGPYQALRQS